MPSPVVVEFVLRGMPDIARAMKTVEQSAANADRARERQSERSSKARTKLEEKEAKDKLRAQVRADAEQRRLVERQVRAAEKAAQQKLKAEERLSREATRETKERARAEEKEIRAMVRVAEKAAADKLRIEQKVNREIAKLEKDRTREKTRLDRERARENEKLLREGLRLEDKTHREQTRAIDKRIKGEEKSKDKFGRAIGSAMMGAARTAGGVVTGAAGMVAQLGGGFSVADAVDRQGQLERSAVMLSNSAYMGKGERMNAKQIAAEANAAAAATGTDATEVLAGAHAFGAKTGEYGEGRQSMSLFSKIAKVTGAKVEDVANTAGTLRIQNSDLKGDAMESMLLQTIRQGQKGSIEFGDLATSVGKITRTSGNYAQDQAKTQAELLGISQLGMKTMSDPRDVATSLAGINADLTKNWENMNAGLGGDQFTKDGRVKSGPSEFIANVMEKTGGDARKLDALGFGRQSMKYFQALMPEFQKAGGGKAGADHLRSVMKESVAEPMDKAELNDNLKRILDTSAEQFDASMRELRTVVGAELLPELTKMIPVLREMMPALTSLLSGFTSLADWATKNPLGGLATLLGAAFTKELASAGVAAALQGGVATGLAGATIAIAAATIAIESIANAQSARVSKEVGDAASGYGEAMGIRKGDTISQESLDNLTAKRDAMQRQVNEEKANVNSKDAIEYVGMAGNVVSLLSGGDFGIGEDHSADYQKQREDRLKLSEDALAAFNRALDMAAKGLVKVGETTDKPAPGAPGSGGAKGGAPAARPATASNDLVTRMRTQ
jgi:hypothetical protein